MQLGKNIIGILTKDVSNENEIKKTAVIIRVCAVIMCCYFLIMLAFLVSHETFRSYAFAGLIQLLANFLVLDLTYQNQTRLAAVVLNTGIAVYVITFSLMFGYQTGIFDFIFFQIVLMIVVDYISTTWKILFTGLLLFMRIGILVYLQDYHIPYIFSSQERGIVQFLHVITTTLLLSLTVIISTKDSRMMERKLVMYNQKLHKLANMDTLTELKNRRCIQEYIERKSVEYQNGAMKAISIAIADIDFFKQINDTYGHSCGDFVLKELSGMFMDFMEDKGAVGRWGGEEFLFVFKDLNGDEANEQLIALKQLIRKKKFEYDEWHIHISLTFGLAEFDLNEGVENTIREADEKLYIGKERGRNVIIF